MSWTESWQLLNELAVDPTSRVGAALSELGYPVDLATVVLADLWDLMLQANSAKGADLTLYPRGWLPKPAVATPLLSQEEIRAALRARGHDV